MPQPSLTEVNTPQSRCHFALGWADITPPAGIYHRMWGAAKHERATGVHRPLRATVAVFAPIEREEIAQTALSLPVRNERRENLPKTIARRELLNHPLTRPSGTLSSTGGEGWGEEAVHGAGQPPGRRQILLALDHCVPGAVEHEQLISHVAQASGEPKESLLVVFSHTHGAGLMGLERAALPGGESIPGYLQSVAGRAAELVRECVTRLAPAAIVYGRGSCRLAAHRDFFDENRRQFVCGFNPGAPADDTVLVARVTDNNGTLLATMVNYACHPTTLAWDNTLVSPDYVGAMREVVEQVTGAPCLFLQGASGDLGPREGYVGDTAVADRNGRELGFAALSALTALPAAGTVFRYSGAVVSGATLGAWAHEPLPAIALERKKLWQLWRWHELLPYRPGQPTLGQAEAALKQFQMEEEKARAAGEVERAAECRAMAERKRRLRHRLSQLPDGDAFPLQVVLWRMGDAFWLGLQGESYSVLQTELRRRFPGTPILVASIAADWGASYLPPAPLYDSGIYQESIAVVAAGSLEQLIEAVARRIASADQCWEEGERSK
jgi:hypothetical protein